MASGHPSKGTECDSEVAALHLCSGKYL